MIDTSLMEAEGWVDEPIEDEEEIEEEDDLFHDIYVEVATDIIHEVQLFPDFVLARPASPNAFGGIRKLNMVDFTREFREYFGDADAVRAYLKTSLADFIVNG